MSLATALARLETKAATTDALRDVHARVLALHTRYEQLEAQKDAASSAAQDARDVEGTRKGIEDLRALVAPIEELVSAGEQLQEQANAAAQAAKDEIDAMESDNDDKLSDVSSYAADWPGEIDGEIELLEAWIAEMTEDGDA
jgi:chromosome segregation ATPase